MGFSTWFSIVSERLALDTQARCPNDLPRSHGPHVYIPSEPRIQRKDGRRAAPAAASPSPPPLFRHE